MAIFGLFEAYLETCLEDCLLEVASCSVPFAYLPDKLQEFLSIDAVAGLSNRVRMADKINKRMILDSEIVRIASYNSPTPTLTSFGLLPSGSNVQIDKVKHILSAFGMISPWNVLDQWCSQIQGTMVSTENSLRELGRLRNKCAHDASFIVPSTNLTAAIEQAAIIGIVVAVALREISGKYRSAVANRPPSLSSVVPTWRFIDEVGSRWAERSPNGRTLKYYASEPQAVAGTRGRNLPNHIVVRNASSIPVELV